MSNRPRIYADFQKIDDHGRLILTCRGTYKDIETQQLVLSSGLEVTFYSDDLNDDNEPDDLVVDGTIEFDENKKIWVGLYDAGNFRHASNDNK